MSTSLFLNVTGLLLTVVLGLLGIFVTVRRRLPGQIVFVRSEAISLFDAGAKNMPRLSILFDGQAVKETLSMLKGTIINAGDLDITKEMVERPLTALLPEGFRWLSVTVTYSSPDLRAGVEIFDARSLVFDLGLFRRKEKISFEALVEAPVALSTQDPSVEIIEKLKLDHRIANTSPVRSLDVRDFVRPSSSVAADVKEVMSIIFVPVVVTVALLVLSFLAFRSSQTFGLYMFTRDGRPAQIVAGRGFPDSYVASEDGKTWVPIGIFEFFSSDLTMSAASLNFSNPISLLQALVIISPAFFVACLPPGVAIRNILRKRRLKKLLGAAGDRGGTEGRLLSD